jgi:Transglutaminase-like superfamily
MDGAAAVDRLPRGVSAQQVVALAERIGRIPDSVRAFGYRTEWAWTRLRLSAELLDFMSAHGLPRRVEDGVPMYDNLDLINVAIHLGLGPVARAAHRFWPLALRLGAARGGIRYEARYHTECPDPGHEGPCRYAFAAPGNAVVECVLDGGAPPQMSVEASTNGRLPALPPEARAVLRAVDDLQFLILPKAFSSDIEFVTRNGFGDCEAVCRILCDEAGARGIPVRPSYGLLVSPPFATGHYWAEFGVGDAWVPVDPVLTREMIRWGVLDAAEWPPHRSIGPIVVRLGDLDTTLATHNGTGAPVTASVRALGF